MDAGLCRHPFCASQASLVHCSLSSQLTSVPAHWPSLHASPLVHAVPSSQGCVFFVVLHLPASQDSLVHGLESLQVSA